MEKEKIDILDREDRENDIDEISLDDFRFEEGVDYKDYLKQVKETICDDKHAVNRKVKKNTPKKESSRKSSKVREDKTSDNDYRTTLIAFMTTTQKGNALRILAALQKKTLSTLINDSINAYLSQEIDRIIMSGILNQQTEKEI